LWIEEFGLILGFVVEDGGLFGCMAFYHLTTRLVIFAVHFDFHGAGGVVLFSLVLEIGD
jgi:hypothetical protein